MIIFITVIPFYSFMTRVLLTGFDDCKSYDSPTKHVIKEFQNKSLDGIELRSVLLPVKFEKSLKKVNDVIEYHKPSIILSLGFGYKIGDQISIEQRGRNIVSGKDDARVKKYEEKIYKYGQDYRNVSFPVEELCDLLNENDIPTAISKDAGEFLCNNLIYSLMRIMPEDVAYGFYHIPDSNKSLLKVDQIVKAVELTFDYLKNN